MEYENNSNNNNNNNSAGLAPPDLLLEDQIFDICFHPQQDFIGVGLITGQVKFYQYSTNGNQIGHDIQPHKQACRSVQFSADGRYMITCSSDRSIKAIDLNTGQMVYSEKRAHDAAVNRIATYLENMLISGDDDGEIKLWDLRQRKSTHTWREHEDYIADFAIAPNHQLIVAGGDGYLSCLNLKKGTLQARSDNIEDDLLSVQIMKNGKKVVAGTQEGVIAIWSWGYWGDYDDRFLGHPHSVDTMVALDADTLCTGSSDGFIRLCSIHPNTFINIVGEHPDFPVEKLILSRTKKILASCSHDQTVKFWNIENLFTDDSCTMVKPSIREKGLQMEPAQPDDVDVEDEEEDSDSDSDGSDDMEAESKPKKNKPVKKLDTNQLKQQEFFKGLM